MPPRHGGNLVWAAAIARCAPEELLDFSASLNPLGPPASVVAALHHGLGAIRDYPDPACTALVQALAATYALDPDTLLVGNGAAELLTWIGRDCAACSRVYLVTPCFQDYGRALRAFAASVDTVPLDQVRHDVQALAAKLHPEDAVILNNPHNPTGHLWSRSAVQALVATGATVVVDEAFMDFLPPATSQTVLPYVKEYPNLIVLRSLTKFYSLAGLRLGYVVSQPERLRRWQQWRDPWSVNALALVAGVAALGDRPFQEQTWQWLAPAREALQRALDQIPTLRITSPSHGNFLLVTTEASVLPLQRYLLEHHRLLIRDCLSFPELGERYFRVAVRQPSDHEQLLRGLGQYFGVSISPSQLLNVKAE
ncbi:threonine-phosphate decarboxylase CobD [Synechococcus sp. PCC 6717]|nr:threonine-phosphate decarboxylase CobD [Synechococcus sp. PCC 6717]